MTYLGGKAQEGTYQTIINQIPPHDRYIEAFLGGGAIMLKKLPAIQNIGMDMDMKALCNFKISCRQNGLQLPALIGMDAIVFLRSTAGRLAKETFLYCDPPYPHSTRRCEYCRYKYELTDEQHLELLKVLKTLSCMVMISTYPNGLYESELAGWRHLTYQVVTRNKGEVTTEALYMNYPEPTFLHDDRYLGTDSGNRQDINRKIRRTVERISNWPRLERVKMLRILFDQIPTEELEYLSCSAGQSAYDNSRWQKCLEAIDDGSSPELSAEVPMVDLSAQLPMAAVSKEVK